MSNPKRFLLTLLIVYVVGSLLGVAMFKTPYYSKPYLAKYGEEHERHHKIMKSEVYKRYIERPNLHPADDHLLADVAFMKEYEARPAFQAEKSRLFYYGMYFKVLNSAVFILLLVHLLRKPLLDFLDNKITEIRTNLDNAAKAREEARRLRAEAQAKVDQWAEIEHNLRRETEASIEKDLARIHEEFVQSQAQLDRETVDRKQAENYRAARLLREEIVNQAIAQLQERYKTEATLGRMEQSVDNFVQIMDRLS
jgi:F0F1-type ATP synthase membrane subunit b/b'